MVCIPIKVSKSKELKGIRCIETERDIAKGEVIEECPLVFIPKTEWEASEKTVVGSYKYAWNKENDCIVLGYCGLVNHSYEPNCIYQRDYKRKVMKYIALRDLKAGEEVLVNYNGDPNSIESLDEDYINYKY